MSGKTDVFFERDPIAALDDTARKELSGTPLEKDALKDQLAHALPGHDAIFTPWLKGALERHVIYKHAKTAASKERFGTEPDLRGSLAACSPR